MRNLFKVATIAATILLASCATSKQATDAANPSAEQPKAEATANNCTECNKSCKKQHKHHHHVKAKKVAAPAPAAAAPATDGTAPAAAAPAADTSTEKTSE